MKMLYVLLLNLLLLYPHSSQAETATPLAPTPLLTARSYLLLDFQTERVLMESNADTPVEPASLTKLMTAYLVFEQLQTGQVRLTDAVKISEKAWRMDGSRTYVEVSTEVPLETLLKGMIIQSGNDASVALAEHLGGGSEEKFVALMNEKAKQLGLTRTHFNNSTGLPDEKHYSTARDIARLAQLIIREFPEYYKWYSEREFTYNNITQGNRNALLWRDNTVDGMKTGYTESARYCMVASAKRGEMRLIAVVLGAEDKKSRTVEAESMLNYGFHSFETYRLYQANEPLNSKRVWQGNTDKLTLGLNAPLYVTIPKGQYAQLNATLHVDSYIIAPVNIGEPHGKLKVSFGNQVVAERPVVALSSVESGYFWQRFVDYVWLKFQ